VAHYWVDMYTFKKNLKKFKKIKIKKIKKTTKWHMVVTVMAVNDLNGISKKGPNWTKLTKIETYLNTKPKLEFIWKNLTKIRTKKYFNLIIKSQT